MRHVRAITLTLLAACFAAASSTAGQNPVPVSPGSPQGVLEIDRRCPTFTWTAGDGAGSHELAVYRLLDGKTEASAEETLRMMLPGGSSAWTPSADRCLEFGERYAWTVRSIDPQGAREWAPPSLFSISAAPTIADVERLLAELREQASSDDPAPSEDADGATIPGPEPRTTNTGGNYFSGGVQVDGQLCAGSDCDDGESFSYAAMVVNADNASLRFEDSSTLAGYPANDWRIVINDVGPGGESYFAIQDLQTARVPFRIEAGADDDAFNIADGVAGFGGDVLVQDGELTTEGVNLASSREWKSNLQPVDPEEILARLAAVPVSTWSFSDEPGVRHIGPVSEDFHSAFALPGHDPRHLAVTDVNGVALAAIQALVARSDEQRLAIEQLRQRNEELERLILALIGREAVTMRWR